MKKVAILLVSLILTVMTFAVCPEQENLDPATCPVTVTSEMLTIDPATGQPRYLGYVMQEIGKQWVYEGYSCTDEQGRNSVVTASMGTLEQTADPNTGYTIYTLRGTITQIGPVSVTISAIVPPGVNETSIERAGSLIVIGTPRVIPAPTLCGGRP